MLDSFVGIDNIEKQKLIDAIAHITVLVAGADGTIDTEEVAWAEKLTKIRSYKGEDGLTEYYGFVGDEFEKSLNDLIKALPEDVQSRNDIISDRLSELNPILAKLDNKNASDLYASFVTFAEHVAKASGGFLRMWNVSSEEKKVMKLPSLNPVERIEEEEE